MNIGVAQDNSLVELINGAVACPLLIEAGTSHALHEGMADMLTNMGLPLKI